ncbi:glycine cleavage system aminomethyltransferase GcvT [Nocardioidaceae bacterium]|nr:glycine cleavage system aminomethyltransferase GcvT [Nocardioidaceae bacterium]
MRQSPLHDRHVALDAKLAEFGGWSMPLEYAGVVAEHTAVRTSVGVFDVSHLGTVLVRGEGAAGVVDRCLTNDLGRIAPGQAQYTLCCDESGGVVDDLIVYLRSPEDLLLVPNAANAAEVARRLTAEAPEGVEVADVHADHAVLAVQGPDSDAVLARVGLPTGHDYMSFTETTYEGADVVVCRTGYTGERGYELVVHPAAAAGPLWDALVDRTASPPAAPCGLGARDTLRTEMGYPLHGHELGPDITPVQARSGWAVGWSKEQFVGREALAAERERGPERVLRGLLAQGRGIPRPGMAVHAGDEPVGEVTSGTFSPTLRQGIALALVRPSVAVDDTVEVDVRGRRQAFTVVTTPFVESSVR